MATEYKAKDVIKAIRRADGVIAAAARILGCTRQTVYNKIEKYKTVREVYEEVNERSLDIAEGKLMQFVRNSSSDNGTFCDKQTQLNAIKYYLSTKGKERGYNKRRELDHDGDMELRVTYADPDD